jgi:hypothetical protein
VLVLISNRSEHAVSAGSMDLPAQAALIFIKMVPTVPSILSLPKTSMKNQSSRFPNVDGKSQIGLTRPLSLLTAKALKIYQY